MKPKFFTSQNRDITIKNKVLTLTQWTWVWDKWSFIVPGGQFHYLWAHIRTCWGCVNGCSTPSTPEIRESLLQLSTTGCRDHQDCWNHLSTVDSPIITHRIHGAGIYANIWIHLGYIDGLHVTIYLQHTWILWVMFPVFLLSLTRVVFRCFQWWPSVVLRFRAFFSVVMSINGCFMPLGKFWLTCVDIEKCTIVYNSKCYCNDIRAVKCYI